MKLRDLPARLPMHPNSIGAGLVRNRWFPLYHLVWLFWMVTAPWMGQKDAAQSQTIALTLFSLLPFLALYWRAWYADQRRIVWNAAWLCALGLVMVPVNTSWSYVIYAAVVIPYAVRPWPAVGWIAALMLAFGAVATGIGFPVVVSLSAITMCVALGLMSLIGSINRRHDAALRLSHDEVRRLAATAERERIGRDLHDLLGHTLSLIAIKGELARRLFDRDADKARHEVAEIERIAREALAQVRSAVTGIRAAGLAAELASARLLLDSSGIGLDCQSIAELALPAPVESALALSLREAVTNVQRHARARRVEISVVAEPRHAVLVVRDDGRGGATPRGNGLAGIEERLRALGGHLLIESPAGHGTRLTLRVPREPAASGTPAPLPSREAA